MENVFYVKHFNSVGGIESFCYYLAKKYYTKDITVFYGQGDPFQIARLRRYVPVRQYKGEHIKCRRAFFNYNFDPITNFEAEEYISVIHGDFKAMGITLKMHPKITKVMAVSKLAADSFEEIFGIRPEVAYNPVDTSKVEKSIRLISATRLTAEKGRDRMEILARQLDNNKVNYTWEIFTNDARKFSSPNIILRPPTLDILPHIKAADWLVQLSDSESYCFSVVEALSMGVPVIVTPCPVYDEIGVVNGKNALVVDWNMRNLPIAEIRKGLKKFKYTPLPDRWGEILGDKESHYKAIPEGEGQVVVKFLRDFVTAEGQRVRAGETIPYDRDRTVWLVDKNIVQVMQS